MQLVFWGLQEALTPSLCGHFSSLAPIFPVATRSDVRIGASLERNDKVLRLSDAIHPLYVAPTVGRVNGRPRCSVCTLFHDFNEKRL